MVAGWGSSKFYSLGQVKAALEKAGPQGPFEAIAYAGLVSEADYAARQTEHPTTIAYDEARRMFERHCARLPSGAYWHDPITNEQAASRHSLGGHF